MKKIVLVDDDRFFCKFFVKYAATQAPQINVQYYHDPEEALKHIDISIDLLILDWEMPKLNGYEVLNKIVSSGMSRKKIIILSSHPSKKLREKIKLGSCLAVLEKYENVQQKILDMLLLSIEKNKN